MTPARTQANCARCQRPLRPPSPRGGPPTPRTKGVVVAVRKWPEGPICSGCYATACETYGTCPGCGAHRLLPGRNTNGDTVCTDCAGNIGNFTCTRCGQEGWNHYAGICGRCVLRERLTTALDDGTGTANPDLHPLLEHLCAMPRPRTGLLWLTKPHTMRLLTTIAHRDVALTHDGIATLDPYKAVAHLRQLLIATGTLPAVDPTLLRIQQWSTAWVQTIEDPEHRTHLQAYARWHLLRRLHQAAATGPLHRYRDQDTRYKLRQAHEFLTWLHEAGSTLDTLTQADLDTWWVAAATGPRTATITFLRWATSTGHAPHVRAHPNTHTPGRSLTQQEHLHWLRRAAHDSSIETQDRLILTLLLLYAQPIARIVQLKTTDISLDERGQHRIHLGAPPAPVPHPFDQLIQDYLDNHRRHTAANPASDWLIPGRAGDLPIHPTTLRLRLHTLGLQPRAAHTATLRQLVTQAPPVVIADLLGYHAATTEHTAKAAGATWSRYAATRTR